MEVRLCLEGPKNVLPCGQQQARSQEPGVHMGLSLISQLFKSPPAIQETPDRFLGWGDPLEKG